MEPLGPPAGGLGGVAKIHKNITTIEPLKQFIIVIELRLTIKTTHDRQKS